MHGVMKINTKVLSIRLSKVINSLITDVQSAFVKGRKINDCFLSVPEIIAVCTKSKTQHLALKLDFEKAFDNVS